MACAPAAPYVREWPAGCLGYTNSARRNATVNQPPPALASEQSRADIAQPSATTLRRWRAQLIQAGHADRRGPGGGRPLKLSGTGAYLLWFLKQNEPDATFVECHEWLQLTAQEEIEQSQWSRELRRLGLTRKKLEWLSRRRDEHQRCEWWINTPDGGVAIVYRGVRGLDHRLLVDLDEKCVWLNACNRTHGHAGSGERARLRRAIVSHARTRVSSPHARLICARGCSTLGA